MPGLDEFADIIESRAALAPFTSFRLGGPAQALARPRSLEELARLVRRCADDAAPFRILGGGSNVLVRDEGVSGVVARLTHSAFTAVEAKGNRVRAAAGATLADLISFAAGRGLAGAESLIGIPGTVGGGLRGNAGSKSGDIGRLVRRLEVMDGRGQIHVRDRDDLSFGAVGSGLEEPIILAAELELEPDSPDSLLKRIRKFWIQKKAHQPLSFQPAGRIFRDPRGQPADQLIEQAGLQGTRVGGAEISDRHANYIIAHPGATARDVTRLIELMRSRIAEQLGVELQLALVVW